MKFKLVMFIMLIVGFAASAQANSYSCRALIPHHTNIPATLRLRMIGDRLEATLLETGEQSLSNPKRNSDPYFEHVSCNAIDSFIARHSEFCEVSVPPEFSHETSNGTVSVMFDNVEWVYFCEQD